MKQERHDEKKQVLLDAAVSVFTQKGFGAATMREIASAAGLTTGALYHHFRNKEDLFYHAVKEAMFFTKRLSATDAASKPKSNESMLREISDRVKERLEKLAEQRLFVLVTAYILESGGENLTDLRSEYEEKIERVAEMYYYAFGVDNPALKHHIACVLIAAMDGMAVQYAIGTASVKDKALRDTFVSFFVESIPAYLKHHLEQA